MGSTNVDNGPFGRNRRSEAEHGREVTHAQCGLERPFHERLKETLAALLGSH
jgi:hypothetical protein